jgi:hypothetical protein
MKLKIFIVISLLVNIWFSFTIIRLEKFHYSTMVGMCSQIKIDDKKIIREYDDLNMYNCLSKSQPRTSDWWNLAHGLKIL